MNVNACTVPFGMLTDEILAIPLRRVPDGSGHGHLDGKPGWIRGLSNTRVRLGETYPYLTQAVDELGELVHRHEVKQVIVNNLEAGAELSAHRDGLPQYDRYHLPIMTNSDAYWWDEIDGSLRMAIGNWYGPVPYCGILHAAGNPGLSDRLHIVADFAHVKGN